VTPPPENLPAPGAHAVVTATADSPRGPVLRVEGLSKAFGSVQALVQVNLNVWPGEVVGLLGDNGAGKSTLVKCTVGRLHADAGVVYVDERELKVRSPEGARASGIEAVYQNLALVDSLDIASNLFLGRETVRGQGVLQRLGLLRAREMRREALRVLDELGVDLGRAVITDPVERLSGGQRQGIAVARVIIWGHKVVLLDEPAAALGVEQTANVLKLVRTLRDRGVGVVFISHNMDQVIEVCDRVAVMRHGHSIGSAQIRNVSAGDLVGFITGAHELPEPA